MSIFEHGKVYEEADEAVQVSDVVESHLDHIQIKIAE